MRAVFEQATGLGDAVRRAGRLSARTVIFDVEPWWLTIVPSTAGVRVVCLASAGKPLRTTAYRRFLRPEVVIGDQVVTDGILARRLGYVFLQVDWPAEVPVGPRLMAAARRLVRTLLFTNSPAQPRA